MQNYANELFLLSTNLSQLKNKDLIKKLFVESLNEIFDEYTFAWDKSGNNVASEFIVCTSNKVFGYIVCGGNKEFTDEVFVLLQNTTQLLAILIEKIEQEELLIDQKNHLNHLVEEKTKDLIENQTILEEQKQEIEFQNIEYRRINKELTEAKEQAEISKESLRLNYKELEAKNTLIQTILDNLPIGIALNYISKEEAIYINKKFSEIYGWPASEIQTTSEFFNKVYPDPEYREQIREQILRDIMSGDPARMHWNNIKITQKDGSIRIVNAVNIALHEQDTMISTVMDITQLDAVRKDLLTAKTEAEESNRLKTAFLQNMSHEIRTPMNAIMGFANLLQSDDMGPGKTENYINIIVNSCKQLLNIVTDILTISSLETNQESISIEEVNINTVILELLSIFKTQATSQNLSFYSKLPLADSYAQIYTDLTKLTQILTNLITNALKFTSEGFIEIGYTFRGHEIEFYVKDTGIGIKQELHTRIFERFHQGETEVSKMRGGTGLGLAISKGFVELLDGRIWLESELGKGSVFYFSLPYRPVIQESAAAMQSFNKEDKPHILIAEDEEYNYLYLEEILVSENYTLIHAKNGQEAIDYFDQNSQIKLILMDIKMPRLDGFSAAKAIKKRNKNIPIVAQTAYALQNEIEQYQGSVFCNYITKPIERDTLLTVVRKYLLQS